MKYINLISLLCMLAAMIGRFAPAQNAVWESQPTVTTPFECCWSPVDLIMMSKGISTASSSERDWSGK